VIGYSVLLPICRFLNGDCLFICYAGYATEHRWDLLMDFAREKTRTRGDAPSAILLSIWLCGYAAMRLCCDATSLV
jgi:hypothetical protein